MFAVVIAKSICSQDDYNINVPLYCCLIILRRRRQPTRYVLYATVEPPRSTTSVWFYLQEGGQFYGAERTGDGRACGITKLKHRAVSQSVKRNRRRRVRVICSRFFSTISNNKRVFMFCARVCMCVYFIRETYF